MGILSGFIVWFLVRLATQALIAFTAAAMTNTAEWNRRSQNTSIRKRGLEYKNKKIISHYIPHISNLVNKLFKRNFP